MEKIIPSSFIQVLAGVFSLLVLVSFITSFWQSIRSHSVRLFAITLISALALFAHNGWVYFASVFIIATAVTETEFLQNLAAIIRGSRPYWDWKLASSGQITAPKEKIIPERSPMEYKILNTLWTKQVNKFPDFKVLFTFRIHVNSTEYLEYREAGSRLIGEGLISESDQGQFYLTVKGFEYCKTHYKEFPSDQWWPEETINQENLRKVQGIIP